MPPKSGFSTHAPPESNDTSGFEAGTGYEHSSTIPKPGFSTDATDEENFDGFAAVDGGDRTAATVSGTETQDAGTREASDHARKRAESVSGFKRFRDQSEGEQSDSEDVPPPRPRASTIDSVESVSGFRGRAKSVSGFAKLGGSDDAAADVDNESDNSGEYAHFPELPDTATALGDIETAENTKPIEEVPPELSPANQRAAERDEKKRRKQEEKEEKKRRKEEAKKAKADEKARKKALAAESKAQEKKTLPSPEPEITVFEAPADNSADKPAQADATVTLATAQDAPGGTYCVC